MPVTDIVTSPGSIDADAWDALAGDHPFVRHAFLAALHDSGCAAPERGWTPVYLTLREGGELIGAMPLYLKTHSRGEYVFDQGWAEAFHRHGVPYYPKLLAAVPFTPVTGPRLLARTPAARLELARAALAFARRSGTSSLHVLFPDATDRQALEQAGFMLREGVQFHWRNRAYPDFDAFLQTMNHDKRKKMRQDRRRVAEAGIRFRRLRGRGIGDDELAFFHRCYLETYRAHGSSPYLSLEFFRRLHRDVPDQLLLVLAERAGVPIACALDVIAGDTLYGRHWGALEFVSGLHFETCYAQAIEYCIEQGLACFEGGAQGLHKLARGLLPVPTWSAHWVADSAFGDAISRFLALETREMNRYLDELEEHTPFKAVTRE